MRSKAAAVAAVLGLAIAFSATSAGAQQKNRITTRATSGRGAATSDQNIKNASATNKKGETIAAPVSKGGKRTRGSDVCALHVDNRTELFVALYTDGNYRGTVSPWGDMVGWVGCGRTTFYARADYITGDYESWGPTSAYVDGPFYWTIRR